MVKRLIVKQVLTDEEIEEKEGYSFTDTDFNEIIDYDCDVYRLDGDKEILLLSFRKNVISEDICCQAYNALEKEAKIRHTNRGAAAGLLDKNKLPKYVKKIVKPQKFRAYYIGTDNRLHKDHISNSVSSGIIGYYDKPDRNSYNPSNINSISSKKNKQLNNTKRKRTKKVSQVPCRTTKFTRDNVLKWKQSIPLIKEADKQFKILVPKRHKVQLKRARKTKDYQIDNTAFSTITLNYNYQTALHKDKGDLEEGFGNLLVLEKSKCNVDNASNYKGGFTGYPQYGVAVDVRQGDFLAMDVHQWHCNTPIINSVKSSKKDTFGRLSIVCYLRKNMIKCSKNNNSN